MAKYSYDRREAALGKPLMEIHIDPRGADVVAGYYDEDGFQGWTVARIDEQRFQADDPRYDAAFEKWLAAVKKMTSKVRI